MTAKRLPFSILVLALLVQLGLAAFPAETLAPAPQGAAAAGLQGFDEFAATVMGEWKIPGVAVGAIRDGKVVLAKGYGYRDVAKLLPVTPRTLMAIGSNSKSFTVTLMGILGDEGKLDWEKPVRTYLPDFELHDEVATRLMTATDLVTHRSGLPRHDAMWLGGTFARKELYQRLRHLPPSATFRQRYQYNNLMFMTAGILVEQVTGSGWDDLIRQKIFTPLGMTASNTTVRDMPGSSDYSYPYMKRGGQVVAVPFRNLDAVAPAGSINSNVDEMLRYVQMHLDQGKFESRQVISPRFAARMQSVHSAQDVTVNLDAPTYTEFGPGGYGLGVAVRSYRGHKHVSHTGGIDGFISSMSWLPHDRLGIVVLTNFSGVNPVAGMLAQNLTDRLLGVEPVDVVARAREAQARSERLGTERERKKEAERIAGTSPSHPLADYAGSYEHPGYGVITIAHDSGRLTLTLGSAVTTFEHFHYDVFRAVKTPDTNDWDPRMRMVFSTGASGKIDTVGVPFEASVPELLFKRKPAVAGTSSAARR